MATRITMYTPANPHGTTTILKHASSHSPSSPPINTKLSKSEAAVLTPFQRRVYHLLTQIPAGRVTTYGSLARALSTSPRAVGNALRNNVYAPRIPCHRCVASTGYVNGYDGEVIQRATFARARDGGAVDGKASQSRAGKLKTTMQKSAAATTEAEAEARRKKTTTEPPSGTNIQMKLDLLKTEGVTFDDKGMLKNKHKVLFDGPWDVLPVE